MAAKVFVIQHCWGEGLNKPRAAIIFVRCGCRSLSGDRATGRSGASARSAHFIAARQEFTFTDPRATGAALLAVVVPPHFTPWIFEEITMNLGEIYHGLINLAEAAHHLAREMLKYPHRDDVGHLSAQDRACIHRAGVSCRDLATGVEHAAKSLSSATLEQISRS